MKRYLILTAFAAISVDPLLAVSCGSVVSGVVTLTEDMNCNSQTALRVGADNTVINLNGHTLTCTGAGFLGSCQAATGQNSLPARGVEAFSKKNVTVNGPGTISGFAIGVLLSNGDGSTVKGVNITGPSQPIGKNQRSMASGIYVGSVECPIVAFGQDAPPSLIIADNTISNQAQGIHLETTGCAIVKGNQIHDINRDSGWGTGIFLYDADNNQIYRNSIFGVGYNDIMDSGITLMQGSSRNTFTGNSISNNCGNGVAVLNKSSQNTFALNVARFNGAGSCPAPPNGTGFADLNDGSTGTGNTWNNNNICKKEAGSVPAGVCNPFE